MPGISQSELDAVVCGSGSDSEVFSSPHENGLDEKLVQRKKRRGSQSTETEEQGLSQEQLDELKSDADSDRNLPASDVEAELDAKLVAKKKTRRVTFSAMKSELVAVSSAGGTGEGLAQSSLDVLVVTDDPCSGRQDLEDLDSALRSCKRKRISVGDGIVGAMVQAADLVESPCKAVGGLSQQQLDDFGVDSDLHDAGMVDTEEASSYALRTKRRLAEARRGQTEPMAEPSPKWNFEKEANFRPVLSTAAEDVENAVCPDTIKEQGKDLDLGIADVFQPLSQSLVSPKRRSFSGYPLSPVKLN